MQPSRAFLLRCWCEGSASLDEEPQWRFSFREIGGEQRTRGFANLEALAAFLTSEVIGEIEKRGSEEKGLKV